MAGPLVSVELPRPQLLLRCGAFPVVISGNEQAGFSPDACGRCQDGGRLNHGWQRAEVGQELQEQPPLSWHVPAGELSHSALAGTVTVGVILGGALLVLLSALQTDTVCNVWTKRPHGNQNFMS